MTLPSGHSLQLARRACASMVIGLGSVACRVSTPVRPPGHQRAPGPLRRQLQGAGADGDGVPGL